MAQHKRGQLGAEAMRTLLACFAQSGLAVAAFCRREGISPSSFYRWRAVLGETSARGAVRGSPAVPATSAADFVELGALQSSGLPLELRLELGGGVFLHLVRG